jgi:hypothetical protein
VEALDFGLPESTALVAAFCQFEGADHRKFADAAVQQEVNGMLAFDKDHWKNRTIRGIHQNWAGFNGECEEKGLSAWPSARHSKALIVRD